MSDSTTVVFADLSGSSAVYEALGNARAAEAITRLTQWIGRICEGHGGRVVKMLGDGVLAVFPDGQRAIGAVVALQRTHAERLPLWPNPVRMRLQIGVASGEVIEVDGDCYGDAVNVASRLSDLSGPDHIWATRPVVSQLASLDDVRVRSLGSIPLRGRTQAAEIFQIDWEEDLQTRQLTRPAGLVDDILRTRPPMRGGVRLTWLEHQKRFRMADLPIHLGRSEEVEFPVNDQRVSRLHARIDWRHGSVVLTDTSSYGTWVRFAGGTAVVALRRDECALVGSGELALGAPFDDFTVPTVQFEVLAAGQ